MKTTIVAGLFALLPLACRAADLPKPFILSFFKEGDTDRSWHDITEYSDGTNADQGTAPSQADEQYLGHYKFTSTDSPKRIFSYIPPSRNGDTDECTVVVNGDPKVDSLTYNLDIQKIVDSGEQSDEQFDLSVIHIRCARPLKDAGKSEPIEDISLADTDFETPLILEFYISDRDNTDELWSAVGVAKPDQDEKFLEEYHDKQVSIRKIARDPADPTTLVKVVGRLVFLRHRSEPRKFSWALHHNPESPSSKQCYVNVNADPHITYVQVNLDRELPDIDQKAQAETQQITVFCPYMNE